MLSYNTNFAAYNLQINVAINVTGKLPSPNK